VRGRCRRTECPRSRNVSDSLESLPVEPLRAPSCSLSFRGIRGAKRVACARRTVPGVGTARNQHPDHPAAPKCQRESPQQASTCRQLHTKAHCSLERLPQSATIIHLASPLQRTSELVEQVRSRRPHSVHRVTAHALRSVFELVVSTDAKRTDIFEGSVENLFFLTTTGRRRRRQKTPFINAKNVHVYVFYV
jgi:hypothetical protein